MTLKKIYEILNDLQYDYGCFVLRIDFDTDIDLFVHSIDNKIVQFMNASGFVLSKEESSFCEFVCYVDGRFVIIEIATTLFRLSRFDDIDLLPQYKENYISNPKSGYVWMKTLRLLLSLDGSAKAYNFFRSNLNEIEKNDFYLNRLNKNPFSGEIKIGLLFSNRYVFILKYLGLLCLVRLMFYKVKFNFMNLFGKNKKKVIAISGVDGAGKSSIISELSKYDDFKSIYGGTRNFVLQKFYDRIVGKNIFFTVLVNALIYLENLLRYLQAKKYNCLGYHVLFDRYPSIEYHITMSKSVKLIYQLFYRFFFPLPCNIIIITGKVEQIMSRKMEDTSENICTLQDMYTKEYGIDNIVVNADGDFDKTVNAILKRLYRK